HLVQEHRDGSSPAPAGPAPPPRNEQRRPPARAGPRRASSMTGIYVVAGVAIVVGLGYIVLLLKLGEGVPPRKGPMARGWAAGDGEAAAAGPGRGGDRDGEPVAPGLEPLPTRQAALETHHVRTREAALRERAPRH